MLKRVKKYDIFAYFDTGVLMIYIYAMKVESCHAVDNSMVRDNIRSTSYILNSNDCVLVFMDIIMLISITSSFLSIYIVKRLHDKHAR